MRLMVGLRADRRRTSATLRRMTTGCALVLVLALAVTAFGCGSSGTSDVPARSPSTTVVRRAAGSPPTGATYTLMQMNLCLSGLSGCYGKVGYPGAVTEAVTRIRAAHPDAVTLNEICRSDVARIARRTGYHLRFSRIVYLGELLHCVDPGGRGLFGDAVLTEAAVEHTDNHDFHAQAGIERRRWLCVTTRVGVDVCTAHLNTRDVTDVAGNDAQCTELAALLARRAAARPVIFGGDVNRRASCAPAGDWTRTDRSARQDPGLQHVYGTRAFGSPSAQVVPAVHTDHDILLVRALLAARR
jgi:endonuclease/exonuclease/phosphatase family metal-dependent hydrolase